jgi:hypothetical protein
MRLELGIVVLLAGCVIWTQHSASTGVTPVSHRPLVGTWVTDDGDSALIRARPSAAGSYSVRLFSASGNIAAGSPWLSLTGSLIQLDSLLMMDLKASGIPDHFQAFVKVVGDTLTVSMMDVKAVRMGFASGKAVTPNLTVDDRESGETRTQLTGPPAELRRFLWDAYSAHRKDWFVDLKPGIRVVKE